MLPIDIAEGSSATDSITDVTDVTDVRKKKEGRMRVCSEDFSRLFPTAHQTKRKKEECVREHLIFAAKLEI